MNINTTLNKNIFYLALVQGSAYILPLLTFPYLVRVLGPTNFGILGFCQATMQYLVILTDYGFNLTATQEVARKRENKDKLTVLFWNVIWSKCFLAFMAFFALFLMCLWIPKYQNNWYVLLAFTPMVLGNVIYPIWFFQGMEKMKWITVCTICARLILIPWVFVYVNSPDDIWIAALAQGATNLIAGLIGCLMIYSHGWVGKLTFSIKEIKECLYNGWHVFASTSAISLYTTSTVVILGFLSGTTAVGYFNAANTIRNAVQGLLNPITQAIYPRINYLYDNDYPKCISLIRKSLNGIGCLSFLTSLFLFVFSPIIIKYGVGENYSNAATVLRILSFLPFIVSLSNIFGVQTMLTHGLKKQFSRILIFAGVGNLLVIFPLITFFKEDGAALSMLFTEAMVTAAMFFYLQKNRILFR
ncbi:flippase [Mixta calida]